MTRILNLGGETIQHIIKCGNTLELITQIPFESIDLIVTSPPYWDKRIYNEYLEKQLCSYHIARILREVNSYENYI